MSDKHTAMLAKLEAKGLLEKHNDQQQRFIDSAKIKKCLRQRDQLECFKECRKAWLESDKSSTIPAFVDAHLSSL
jgi:hypothetical protein